MQSTIQYIKAELESVYPKLEVQGLTRIIIEWATGWNYTKQQLNRQVQLEKPIRQKIDSVVERLKNHEPIQYILEETEFFGLKIKVTPAVLIPRPETEELVKWILDNNKKERSKILDIGTGSGCIALALKSQLKSAEMSGVDISESAIEVARENSKLNQLQVNFFKADILNWEEMNWDRYDVIVSNPPYVRESEKLQMQKNVLDFEPENALFVSDDDPLIFYRKISAFASEKLNIGGQLFFEINENFAAEMESLLLSMDFKNIEIKKDINDKIRMVGCRKKDEE